MDIANRKKTVSLFFFSPTHLVCMSLVHWEHLIVPVLGCKAETGRPLKHTVVTGGDEDVGDRVLMGAVAVPVSRTAASARHIRILFTLHLKIESILTDIRIHSTKQLMHTRDRPTQILFNMLLKHAVNIH